MITTLAEKEDQKYAKTKKVVIGVCVNEDKRRLVAAAAGSLHRLKDLSQMLYISVFFNFLTINPTIRPKLKVVEEEGVAV